uniref:triose-phosphate isomerase n=1 Tax=uncultured prokaryote TaxID=198431 RepID=H5SEK8_9ZZZZ|nr:triosephosphate isomerase [uncultured prokaryote]
MERRPLIAGNWKMHKTIDEAIRLASELKLHLKDITNCDVVIAPPFTALYVVHQVIENTPIYLGAQDLFWEEEGAYTGEISAMMLKDVGCRYVIVGHSERRRYLKEDNLICNRKIKAALNADLIPIYCVGETMEERGEGRTFSVVEEQLMEGLKGIELSDRWQIVIAYEPVWAIGTGKNATPEEAEEVHLFIRKLLGGVFKERIAMATRIIYGGSVTPENAEELMDQKNIDGLLVGGASLKASSFARIVKYRKQGERR